MQGRGVDSPLNANGLKQAAAFYEAYKDIPFDKIYTSTLLRTHQTVEPFLQHSIAVEQLEGLDEISWGIYEGQEQNASIMKGFEELVGAWRNDELDVRVENGESPNELVLRQRQAIDYMLTKEDEERILVCMHGRALRIMLCHLTNVPVCRMDDFPHTNTALYVLDYEDGVFSISDYYNTEHLKGLL